MKVNEGKVDVGDKDAVDENAWSGVRRELGLYW
jgi:hypothetical protein